MQINFKALIGTIVGHPGEALNIKILQIPEYARGRLEGAVEEVRGVSEKGGMGKNWPMEALGSDQS